MKRKDKYCLIAVVAILVAVFMFHNPREHLTMREVPSPIEFHLATLKYFIKKSESTDVTNLSPTDGQTLKDTREFIDKIENEPRPELDVEKADKFYKFLLENEPPCMKSLKHIVEMPIRMLLNYCLSNMFSMMHSYAKIKGPDANAPSRSSFTEFCLNQLNSGPNLSSFEMIDYAELYKSPQSSDFVLLLGPSVDIKKGITTDIPVVKQGINFVYNYLFPQSFWMKLFNDIFGWLFG